MKIKRVSIEISVDQLQETDSRTPKLLHKSGPAFAKSHTDCKFFTHIQLLQYDIIRIYWRMEYNWGEQE